MPLKPDLPGEEYCTHDNRWPLDFALKRHVEATGDDFTALRRAYASQ